MAFTSADSCLVSSTWCEGTCKCSWMPCEGNVNGPLLVVLQICVMLSEAQSRTGKSPRSGKSYGWMRSFGGGHLQGLGFLAEGEDLSPLRLHTKQEHQTSLRYCTEVHFPQKITDVMHLLGTSCRGTLRAVRNHQKASPWRQLWAKMQPPARIIAKCLLPKAWELGQELHPLLPSASHKTPALGLTFALMNTQAPTFGFTWQQVPVMQAKTVRDVTFVWIALVCVIFLLYIELYTLVLFLH